LKIHQVPLQNTEEDKIFGGFASIRQAIYLAIGFFLAASWGVLLYSLQWPGGLFFFALIPVGVCVYLAYGRMERYDLNVDRYLVLRGISYFQVREYPYRQDPGQKPMMRK
jgi:hypothetical protein